MCAILWEGKGPGFGELGGCASTVFWEEALSEPLWREVLELKYIEHILNLLQSEKDKIFSEHFFLFVQTLDCWSETSLLLNLQCKYMSIRGDIIFPAHQKINLSGLILACVLKCFTLENQVWLYPLPSPFFLFPSLLYMMAASYKSNVLICTALGFILHLIMWQWLTWITKWGGLCRRYPSAVYITTKCCW